mmetsp:Transcript_12757/g.34286  ORF Transcript_12757/g.34286 Transcript_12757/m.34286 type:complete len:149 (+) Transcript_12757:70-516(+)
MRQQMMARAGNTASEDAPLGAIEPSLLTLAQSCPQAAMEHRGSSSISAASVVSVADAQRSRAAKTSASKTSPLRSLDSMTSLDTELEAAGRTSTAKVPQQDQADAGRTREGRTLLRLSSAIRSRSPSPPRTRPRAIKLAHIGVPLKQL